MQTPSETQLRSDQDLLAAIEPVSGGREIRDPATGEVVGRAPEHSVADLDAAVAAARAAQPGWAG
ncbi:aldehyde dehydrogenase family protein, partial [Arthrobacter halodurans]